MTDGELILIAALSWGFVLIIIFGVLVFLARFIAYSIGHYDKPEESGDSEEDTKKAIGPYILFGLVLFALLSVLATAAYQWV